MTDAETWIIEEPNAGAPIDLMEMWLFDADIAIKYAESEAHREALKAARARVLSNLRLRKWQAHLDRQKRRAVKSD